MNWTAPTGAASYDIYRNTVNNSATATEITTPGSQTATSCNDTAVTAGTTYYYWVDATNGGGTGAWSSDASGVCTLVSAPTSVTASVNTYTDGVHLSWTAPTGATGYNVYRNFSNTTTGATEVNASSVTTTTYDDTSAVAGTTYYYWVVATNAAGTSAYSTSQTGERLTGIPEVEPNNSYTTAQNLGTVAAPNCTLIGGLSSSSDIDWYKFVLPATGDSNSKVQINFTGASERAAALYTNPATSGAVASSTNATNSASISLSGMAATTYYVRIWGSAAYSYIMIVTPPAPPAAPTGLTASQNTYDDHVALSWTAATGATGYGVYRSTTNNSASATKINSSTVTTTTYSDTTAAAATTYYYWVVGVNANGNSAFSADASGSCTLVLAPTNVTASNGTYYDHVAISWTASSGATAYEVLRNTVNDSSGATQINASDITTTSYNDTTATAEADYYYWVEAKNSAGTSAVSTDALGVRAALTAPTGLTASTTYADGVHLSLDGHQRRDRLRGLPQHYQRFRHRHADQRRRRDRHDLHRLHRDGRDDLLLLGDGQELRRHQRLQYGRLGFLRDPQRTHRRNGQQRHVHQPDPGDLDRHHRSGGIQRLPQRHQQLRRSNSDQRLHRDDHHLQRHQRRQTRPITTGSRRPTASVPVRTAAAPPAPSPWWPRRRACRPAITPPPARSRSPGPPRPARRAITSTATPATPPPAPRKSTPLGHNYHLQRHDGGGRHDLLLLRCRHQHRRHQRLHLGHRRAPQPPSSKCGPTTPTPPPRTSARWRA